MDLFVHVAPRRPAPRRPPHSSVLVHLCTVVYPGCDVAYVTPSETVDGPDFDRYNVLFFCLYNVFSCVYQVCSYVLAVFLLLENRQRRFGLRLLSLPHGNQAQEVVGGKRLERALGYSGRAETAVLLEEPRHSMPIEWGRGSRVRDRMAERSGRVGTKTHMATTRKPTTQSAPPSPGHSKLRQGDRRHRRGSPSSRTPKPPSDAQHRKTLAEARCTRSRRGGTSRPYGGPAWASSSRSGGARLTGESQATRSPMSGPSSRRRTRMHPA
jgi:hypothetical protein